MTGDTVDTALSDPSAAARTTERLSVYVFCGARPGTSPEAVRPAHEAGVTPGLHGHDLVYGSVAEAVEFVERHTRSAADTVRVGA